MDGTSELPVARLEKLEAKKRMIFVRAGEIEPSTSEAPDDNFDEEGGEKLTGCEARAFYEGLLLSDQPSTSTQSIKMEVKEEPIDDYGEAVDHQSDVQITRAVRKPKRKTRRLVATKRRYYCCYCEKEFSGDPSVHETTTTHILSKGMKGTEYPGYGISETNIGYRMLKQTGWDEHSGLGKEGEGKKFPVQTVLKRDRTGVGAKQEVPRVTHFGPNDERAVETERKVRRSQLRKELRAKEERDRKMARNFRASFNVSDEVAAYLGI